MVDSVENNSSDDSAATAASANANSADNGGMNRAQRLQEKLLTVLAGIGDMSYDFGEVTLEVKPSELLTTCEVLRDHSELAFAQLIDLCGVALGFGFAVKCASRVVLCLLCVCVLLLFWLAVLW